MNKKIKITMIVVLIIGAAFLLSSCSVGNRRIGFDTTQTFNEAVIRLGEEVKIVNVRSWRDFDDSDVVQVEASDGSVYLTHYTNVVLIKRK